MNDNNLALIHEGDECDCVALAADAVSQPGYRSDWDNPAAQVGASISISTPEGNGWAALVSATVGAGGFVGQVRPGHRSVKPGMYFVSGCHRLPYRPARAVPLELFVAEVSPLMGNPIPLVSAEGEPIYGSVTRFYTVDVLTGPDIVDFVDPGGDVWEGVKVNSRPESYLSDRIYVFRRVTPGPECAGDRAEDVER